MPESPAEPPEGPEPTRFRNVLRFVPALAAAAVFQLVYTAEMFHAPHLTTPLLFVLLAIAAAPFAGHFMPKEALSEGLERTAVRMAAFISLWMLGNLVSQKAFQGFAIYPDLGPRFDALLLLVVLMCAMMLFRPPRPRVALGLFIVGALLIRSFGFSVWQIHPFIRDMLPLVISAVETFLGGDNPYTIHTMQVGSEVPLTYPPLLWLSHIPARLLSVDTRWTNLVADAIVAGSLGLAALRWSRTYGAIVLVGVAAYLYSPEVHWNGIYAEPHVDWAVLSLLLAAIMSRRPYLIGVAYGLALLTRPFHIVYGVLVFIWAARQFGSRVALRTMAIGGSVAACGFLPFVLADPDAFFFGTVEWLVEYGAANHEAFFNMLGFSGMLYRRELDHWLLPAQLIVLAVMSVLALWRLRATRGLLGMMLLTYAGFIAFNSLIWMSFWIPVGLMAIAVAVTDRDEAMHDPITWRSGPKAVLLLELAAIVGVLASGGIIAAKLRVYLSDEGREEVRALLQQDARPGDLVLDLSGHRLQFVQTPPLFEPNELPDDVVLATRSPFQVDLPSGRNLSLGSHVRVWVVERYHLLEPYESLFGPTSPSSDPLYDLTLDTTVGRYRVLRFERAARQRVGSLLERLNRLQVQLVLPDRSRDGVWRNDRFEFRGAPDWSYPRSFHCWIGGRRRRLIWAHPVQDGHTELMATVPQGARWLVVEGGLEDECVEWRRLPVEVDVWVDQQLSETIEFRNRSGMFGDVVSVPPGASSVTLSIHGHGDVGRRFFCVNGTFWR